MIRQGITRMVQQPEKSSICGHCCIAMVTGHELEEVIQLMGHRHGTQTRELHRVLRDLGYSTDPYLTKIKTTFTTRFPDIAILKITYDWRKHSGHWVYYEHGLVYCPSGDIRVWSDYVKFGALGRITSYLKIS